MDFRWKQVLSLRNRDGDGCCWCGMLLRYPPGHERRRKGGAHGPDDVTIEHLVPVSKGGTDDESNLLLAHAACNVERATDTDRQPLWFPPPPLPEAGNFGTIGDLFRKTLEPYAPNDAGAARGRQEQPRPLAGDNGSRLEC